VTVQPVCDLCGNPTDGFVCQRCTAETAGYLRHLVDLAGEVETNVARLARYASRGGHRAAPADEVERGPSVVNRRQPVPSFGWPASKDQPKPGALRPSPLPVDLNASARAAHAFNDVTTWARTVAEERGQEIVFSPIVGPRCGRGVGCPHPSCDFIRMQMMVHPAAYAASFLLGQLDWIRHQPFADEANEQLRAAGAVVRRIVDAPAQRLIVGQCDCGAYLYAYEGAATVVCEECRLGWDVQDSRAGLRELLREYLMTAAEAAVLLALFGLAGDRNRCRKTIVMWGLRGLLERRGEYEGDPVYRFGDVLDRAAAREAAA